MNLQKKNVKQIYNLPDETVFCKKCVVSNQRPRITYNENGVCSACLWTEFKRTMINWDKKEKELEELCNKFRSKDGSWDVVVPSSGGKDSALVAHQLKERYGMACLRSFKTHFTCNHINSTFNNYMEDEKIIINLLTLLISNLVI